MKKMATNFKSDLFFQFYAFVLYLMKISFIKCNTNAFFFFAKRYPLPPHNPAPVATLLTSRDFVSY